MRPVLPATPAVPPLVAPRPAAARAPAAGLLASFASLLAGPLPRRPAPAGSPAPPASPAAAGAAPAGAPDRAARRPGRPDRDEQTKKDSNTILSLDPLDRALLAQRPPLLSPPLAGPAAPPPAVVAPATPLDQLVERLLRRVALGGSRDRGVAVLRVGAGPLDGAQLTITAEGRSVRVEVSGASGPEAEAWRARLQERLRQRGLDAHVEVS